MTRQEEDILIASISVLVIYILWYAALVYLT